MLQNFNIKISIVIQTKLEEVCSSGIAQALQNLARASMMINRSPSMQDYATQQMFINNQIQQDTFNAMQMHRQAVDTALHAHNMAVQMSTPGMGIV